MSFRAFLCVTNSSVAWFASILRALRCHRRFPRAVSRDAARLSTTVQAAYTALPQGPSLQPGFGAGYNYDSHWMALSMGLSPIRLTSSLAAHPRNLMKVVSVTALFSARGTRLATLLGTQQKGPRTGRGPFRFEISGAQLLFRCSKKLGSAIPIHHIPPGLDVIAAHVLILQIVRVLPNVETQDGFRVTAEQIGCVLIGSGVDGQFAVLQNEPRPAGTEAAEARGRELFLKTGK